MSDILKIKNEKLASRLYWSGKAELVSLSEEFAREILIESLDSLRCDDWYSECDFNETDRRSVIAAFNDEMDKIIDFDAISDAIYDFAYEEARGIYLKKKKNKE